MAAGKSKGFILFLKIWLIALSVIIAIVGFAWVSAPAGSAAPFGAWMGFAAVGWIFVWRLLRRAQKKRPPGGWRKPIRTRDPGDIDPGDMDND